MYKYGPFFAVVVALVAAVVHAVLAAVVLAVVVAVAAVVVAVDIVASARVCGSRLGGGSTHPTAKSVAFCFGVRRSIRRL